MSCSDGGAKCLLSAHRGHPNLFTPSLPSDMCHTQRLGFGEEAYGSVQTKGWNQRWTHPGALSQGRCHGFLQDKALQRALMSPQRLVDSALPSHMRHTPEGWNMGREQQELKE